ncbi:hypothetical protein [Sandaracinus amylolyticus]|uniref:hypothetical protein n=1 Tax=Sandaracinus amylolyticus TaxID=927083 RepID=UPI001F184831|nr:hypothetical protein [Sandaracinus amylolyticus]
MRVYDGAPTVLGRTVFVPDVPEDEQRAAALWGVCWWLLRSALDRDPTEVEIDALASALN